MAALPSTLIAPRPGGPLDPATPEFPWPTVPLALGRLQAYLAACVARSVGYGLGCKAPAQFLDACPPEYRLIDCSGWVRAALANATRMRTLVPDGSVNMNDWCGAQGLKRSNLVSTMLRDNIVRIAFHRPNDADNIGHVWLTYNGMTMESWGGHGPGSRPWSTHILKILCTDVYILALPDRPAPGG